MVLEIKDYPNQNTESKKRRMKDNFIGDKKIDEMTDEEKRQYIKERFPKRKGRKSNLEKSMEKRLGIYTEPVPKKKEKKEKENVIPEEESEKGNSEKSKPEKVLHNLPDFVSLSNSTPEKTPFIENKPKKKTKKKEIPTQYNQYESETPLNYEEPFYMDLETVETNITVKEIDDKLRERNTETEELSTIFKAKKRFTETKKVHLESKTIPKASHYGINDPIHCWWCTYEITSLFRLPVEYKQKTDTFQVKGYFCSPNCALSFTIEEKGDRYLIPFYIRKMHSPDLFYEGKSITPAPNRFLLKKFGGPLTRSEFQEKFRCDLIPHILHQREIPTRMVISDHKASKLHKNDDGEYRLKRNKRIPKD